MEMADSENEARKNPNLEEESGVHSATQLQLIWWRFRRHKLAMLGGIVLILLYLVALFAPFVSPHDPRLRSRAYRKAPPQQIHFFDQEGNFHLRPFVYPLEGKMDPDTLQKIYKPDIDNPAPIHFLVEGYEYKLFKLFTMDTHLFGTGKEDVPVHIFGTDDLGRGIFDRVIYGSQISLSIGLIGVFLSFFLGILIGGIGGFYGGSIDMVIQRTIEILRSIPKIPLWMGLSAAIPTSWNPIQTYFAITIILSLLGWTGLARQVRGRFLSLQDEDFVIAAQLAGRNQLEIIFIHMLPSFLSHIIASLTLAIPRMILGETALSFLGIGLRPPVISWGVLLQAAQNVQAVAMTPWYLIPGLFVIITVLAFNFLGDGLRDAADPYS